MTFEEELASLSVKCKNYIRSGQISMYSNTLKEMADLFHRNNRVKEQIKFLTISFYIDLSGFGCAPFIDHELVNNVQTAMLSDFIKIPMLEQLFYEWIQPGMMSQHPLDVKDCWYLFRLCAEGKVEQADYVLTKI